MLSGLRRNPPSSSPDGQGSACGSACARVRRRRAAWPPQYGRRAPSARLSRSDDWRRVQFRPHRFDAGEDRPLLEPRARRRRPPQCLTLRVGEAPPNGFEIGIDSLVVGAIDLDAVAVGIADIEEERIRYAVPARPTLDIAEIAGGRHQVEQVDNVERGRDPERDMVKARTQSVRKGDVMDAALAMHPSRPKLRPVVGVGIFRHAKADRGVKFRRRPHVRRKAIEMVDAQRLDAAIERIFLMDRRQPLHADIEFERYADIVARAKSAALIRRLDPARWKSPLIEKALGSIEMILVEDLEGERTGQADIPFFEDQAVMAALLH